MIMDTLLFVSVISPLILIFWERISVRPSKKLSSEIVFSYAVYREKIVLIVVFAVVENQLLEAFQIVYITQVNTITPLLDTNSIPQIETLHNECIICLYGDKRRRLILCAIVNFWEFDIFDKRYQIQRSVLYLSLERDLIKLLNCVQKKNKYGKKMKTIFK